MSNRWCEGSWFVFIHLSGASDFRRWRVTFRALANLPKASWVEGRMARAASAAVTRSPGPIARPCQDDETANQLHPQIE